MSKSVKEKQNQWWAQRVYGYTTQSWDLSSSPGPMKRARSMNLSTDFHTPVLALEALHMYVMPACICYLNNKWVNNFSKGRYISLVVGIVSGICVCPAGVDVQVRGRGSLLLRIPFVLMVHSGTYVFAISQLYSIPITFSWSDWPLVKLLS